ncbi:MAG: AAA family ATPase [Victivallales bacterium]|nr:AAA family ATPase [Victivallales bacterium]
MVHIQTSSSDFPQFIEDGSYYVDKTLLVQEIIEQNRQVVLYTRPRRFGKSLNQNMLQAFFDVQTAEKYKHLFDGLAISKNTKLCEKHQGKYPVIKLSFASATMKSFEDNRLQLATILKKTLWPFFRIINSEETAIFPQHDDLCKALKTTTSVFDANLLLTLTEFLHLYYGQKCIILLDEYDVPIQTAFLHGYYEEMLDIMRPIMTSTFKDNPHLRWGVITGCLKVAKESIFTGFNNPYVNTILSNCQSQEHFGFTQQEVDELLRAAELSNCNGIVKKWYDGYLFGRNEVYNPFSVVNFVATTLDAGEPQPRSYWANSSGNDIIRRLLRLLPVSGVRDNFQALIDGKSITLPITENTVFRDMDNDPATLWSTMLFTGYLKPAAPVPADAVSAPMVLPNNEVKNLIERIILSWLREDFRPQVTPLIEALLKGDAATAQNELSRHLRETISCRDFLEQYYHGFLTGLLAAASSKYRTSSNLESGDGYPDIQIGALDYSTAAVLEVKHTSDEAKLTATLDEVEKQFRPATMTISVMITRTSTAMPLPSAASSAWSSVLKSNI